MGDHLWVYCLGMLPSDLDQITMTVSFPPCFIHNEY